MNNTKPKVEKARIANSDFDLLLKPGTIGFYQGCEITQIFIFDKATKTAKNFFALFCFDELETNFDSKTEIINKERIILSDTYFAGILRKRVTISTAKQIFMDIQSNKLVVDEQCQISKDLSLIPKVFVANKTTRDFSFANFTFHETTRAFSLGFMSSNSEKENLLLIGEKLLKKIKESEIKSFTDFNSYFGIFDILINYFFSIGLSKEEYINRIKESSDEIYLLQNSWDYSNLTCNWFSLWFLIISNKIYNYCFNEEKIIEAAPVLFDKRNWIALGDKENVFVNMINILKSPETEDGILVLLNNKEVRLSLNNGE